MGWPFTASKIWILLFLQGRVSPPPALETACLACSQNEFAHLAVHLALMANDPWFSAVLAHGAALTHPFGSIWIPHPRVASGLCDQITCPTNGVGVSASILLHFTHTGSTV